MSGGNGAVKLRRRNDGMMRTGFLAAGARLGSLGRSLGEVRRQ
jgi:hypothetical protein